jgi:hypothetical protein
VADVDIPQVLLESGKFVQVAKIVESLVGAKKPSAGFQKEIKNLQKDINVNVSKLFDEYLFVTFFLPN